MVVWMAKKSMAAHVTLGNLKTRDEWEDLGRIIKSGQRAIWVDSAPYFFSSQTVEKPEDWIPYNDNTHA